MQTASRGKPTPRPMVRALFQRGSRAWRMGHRLPLSPRHFNNLHLQYSTCCLHRGQPCDTKTPPEGAAGRAPRHRLDAPRRHRPGAPARRGRKGRNAGLSLSTTRRPGAWPGCERERRQRCLFAFDSSGTTWSYLFVRHSPYPPIHSNTTHQITIQMHKIAKLG